jgi:hypothetical protein
VWMARPISISNSLWSSSVTLMWPRREEGIYLAHGFHALDVTNKIGVI